MSLSVKYFSKIYQFLTLPSISYDIYGSGGSAKDILNYINKNNLKKPENILDTKEINLDNNFSTTNINKLNIDYWAENKIVVVASLSFFNQIKQRLEDKFPDLEGRIIPLTCFLNENQKHIPLIYINTIPKCGNKFIANNLRLTPYCHSQRDISAGPWGNSNIHEFQLKTCAKEGGVLVGHASPTLYNVGVLNDAGINKIIMHVRDPRSATISWLHWLVKRKNKLSAWELPPSENYFQLPLTKQVDELLSYWLPSLVEHIQGWININNNESTMSVLFTEFSEMKNSPQTFFQKIIDNYHLDLSINVKQPKEEWHFRSGQENEWIDVFTEEQKKYASSLIPTEMKQLFGWLD